jgi:hypothetical protein
VDEDEDGRGTREIWGDRLGEDARDECFIALRSG